MVGDAIAGLGALKTAFDLAKGLKDLNDASVRNRAVADLLQQLISAQEHQQALLKRVDALEAEVVSFKNWEREKQRYELKTVSGSAVAYMLKPTERGTEPPHWLCPTCYAKSQKAFLQPTGATTGRTVIYRCTGCQANVGTAGGPHWRD